MATADGDGPAQIETPRVSDTVQFIEYDEVTKLHKLDLMGLTNLLSYIGLLGKRVYVVAVLGQQGMGKSTMLNEIVRRCLPSSISLRLTGARMCPDTCHWLRSSAPTSRAAAPMRSPDRRRRECGQHWSQGRTGDTSWS